MQNLPAGSLRTADDRQTETEVPALWHFNDAAVAA